MKLAFAEPVSEPVTIKVRWNDTEVLSRDFAAGETPSVAYDGPAGQSGRARAFMVKGGK